MADESTQGFAIRRNGTCSAQETKCQQTWKDGLTTTIACCPNDTSCSNSGQPNTICCPNGLNCTQEIEAKKPACANPTWDLYEQDGYFCCEPDQAGYYIRNTIWVGCYSPSTHVSGKYLGLPVYTHGEDSSSSSSVSLPTSTSTSTSTASSTETASSSSSSSNHKGAIAGGVIGGVAGVALILIAAFFLYRRRKQQHNQPTNGVAAVSRGAKNNAPRELEGQNKTEVVGVHDYPANPSPAQNQPPVVAAQYFPPQSISTYDYSTQTQPYPSHQSPAESIPAHVYPTQQLHELPADRRSKV